MKRFPLGTIEVTPKALTALETVGIAVTQLLSRHRQGDWGNVSEFRRRMNERANETMARISSAYPLSDGNEILVITDRDYALTRVLLAEELEQREVSALEGYAAWATSYDQGRNPLIEIEEPHVDALLADLSVTRALDVGTGTGRHARKLARHGIAVVGVDQSPEMLQVACQAAHAEDLTIDFVRASLDVALPLQTGQFDLLICALALTHVAHLPQVLREFYRVVAAGGHLLITDFHPDAIHELGWRTVCDPEPGVTYTLPNMPYTRADYLDAITGAGFTLRKVEDVRIRELPEADFPLLVRDFGDTSFCLIALAQR